MLERCWDATLGSTRQSPRKNVQILTQVAVTGSEVLLLQQAHSDSDAVDVRMASLVTKTQMMPAGAWLGVDTWTVAC